MRPPVALTAGICWSLLFGGGQLEHRLPTDHEGSDLVVEGQVASLPIHHRTLLRFELAVKRLFTPQGEPLPLKKLRLSWHSPPSSVEPGQVWRLKVRLKRPGGLQNPAGFDYEQWLFTQRIGATGYVRKWSGNQLLQEGHWMTSLQRLRYGIADQIDEQLGGGPAAGLIKALSLGDRRAFDQQGWTVFSRTGTSHLIAISGLHVGLVAGWFWFLGQWCWRRSVTLTQYLPAQRAGAILGLLGAVIYAALAGFTLPTQRALIMLSVALGGVILAQPVRPARSLSLALFLVVLIDPPAPLTVGFWLSFGAVGVILLALGGRLRSAGRVVQLLRVQAAVSLGLMPLLFVHFGEASVISPLVNLVQVPWFSLVLVPMCLIGLLLLPLPGLAAVWYGLLESLAGYTFHFIAWFAQLPVATMQLAHLPVWLAIISLLGVVLSLLPIALQIRSLGLLLLAPLLFVEPDRPEMGAFRFTLLDVGQGLACVVETADHVLLYDTGPAYTSGFNATEASVLPYLASRDLRQVDRLVVSNGDRDHAGGLEVLLKSFQVDDVLSGEAGLADEARPCHAGQSWTWDGVDFQVLHPPPGKRFKDVNDNSCVVRVSNGFWTLLLPGDIEAEGESSLLMSNGKRAVSDILVAPHHGSATSSGQDFVDAVSPDWVIFSAGYRNRYGFPRQQVVERWIESGATVMNSAETGAVTFLVNADLTPPEVIRQRDARRRYWHR
jgi:competence protein ComEC